MKGTKCSYCGKKLTDTLYAPYCSRLCVQAIASNKGGDRTLSSDVASAKRQVKKTKKKTDQGEKE